MFKRLIASLVCLTFSFSNLQYVHAQASPATGGDFSVNQLPVPGTMVGVSTPFFPLALKGLIVNPQKPLEFQFIVDTGRGPQDTASVKEQANQLVKYFLAGLTIPEGDLWVNLSPYEKDRMIPSALGQTDLGRDLLAQDYILKQLTASLIYPEKDLGKAFWSRVYARAQQQFGTTNVPVNTFNKVWILPDQAQVFENGNAAYVTKSTLKVMLDEDYLALNKNVSLRGGEADAAIFKRTTNDTHTLASQIVREIVIPEITKEVNTGKNFAPLRQIYQALILAKWYKETIQNGLLDALYTNKNKVAGVNLNDPSVKEQIYERYLKAYKKGAFNYIKEDPTPDGQVVPRKYFSGGITKLEPDKVDHSGRRADVKSDGAMAVVGVDLEAAKAVPDNELVRRMMDSYGLGKGNEGLYKKVVQAGRPAVSALLSYLSLKNYVKGEDGLSRIIMALGEIGDESAIPKLLEVELTWGMPFDTYATEALRKISSKAQGQKSKDTAMLGQKPAKPIDLSRRRAFIGVGAAVAASKVFASPVAAALRALGQVIPTYNQKDIDTWFSAVDKGDLIAMQAILDSHPDIVNERASDGATALIRVSQNPDADRDDIVRELIKRGADVNLRDGLDWTSLMWTSLYGKLKTVTALLENNADVNHQAKNKDYYNGATALILASSESKIEHLEGKVKVVKLLLKYKADVNAKDARDHNALWFAKAAGYNEIVQMLEHPDTADKAMFGAEKGGIDLNKINVNRTGKTVNVQFDPAQLDELMRGGFEGFTPVIINITPVANIYLLLGLKK